MATKLTVWSPSRGVRTLKEGVTLAEYQQRFPLAIKVRRPSMASLERMSMDEVVDSLDGCSVEPDGICEHGLPSWLRALGWI